MISHHYTANLNVFNLIISDTDQMLTQITRDTAEVVNISYNVIIYNRYDSLLQINIMDSK
jgi:hypothetical protein